MDLKSHAAKWAHALLPDVDSGDDVYVEGVGGCGAPCAVVWYRCQGEELRPGSGPGGKFFWHELGKMGFDADVFYHTTLIKCEPSPDTPPAEQMQQYRDAVVEELGIVGPRVVLLLGPLVCGTMLGRESVDMNHYRLMQWLPDDGPTVFCTWAPEEVLATGGPASDLYPDWWQDIDAVLNFNPVRFSSSLPVEW